ncbi:hypothetical protein Taro_017396 [Colocasia esculenta]|uniref:Cyclin-dependent kinase inhibitor n=1 Tax=Colocasia esculenta TaxID=4460 RepID=A0A843UR19_COLES|nr:hypothetical protein [Colocasia esculenta]
MGKYMRKCGRGIGEVAVMEVAEVAGVRTRARALALAAAAGGASGEAGRDARQKRRKVEGGEFHVSYLQLRSRNLILTPAKNKKAAAAASDAPAASRCSEMAGNSGADGPCGSSCGDGECDRVSRCSSNASSEVVAAAATVEKACSRSGFLAPEVDDCSETTACNYEGDLQRWRERTPSSEQQERESDDLESTARPGESGGGRRRNAPSAVAAASGRSAPPLIPSEAEIDEFFAAAEKQEWQRFAQK